MPRDISGNYTLPVGNPVVDGTIIDVGWANPTMADVAVQLNNVITRDGVLGATAPIKFDTGSAAAPSITFTADPALGFYRGGTNILGFSTAGVSRGTINATGNWTIPAPSSGVPLAVNGAQSLLSLTTTVARGSGGNYLEFLDPTGNKGFLGYTGANDNMLLRNTLAGLLSFATSGINRIDIAAAGNVTINAPSSGITLDMLGFAGATNVFKGSVTGGDANVTIQSITSGNASFKAVTAGIFTHEFRSNRSNSSLEIIQDATVMMTFGPNRNVTIAAPSSGNTLTLSAISGQNGVTVNVAAAATSYPFVSTNATSVGAVAHNSDNSVSFGTTSAHTTHVMAGGSNKITIAAAGNVTINAPSSGASVTAEAAASTSGFHAHAATKSGYSMQAGAGNIWWITSVETGDKLLIGGVGGSMPTTAPITIDGSGGKVKFTLGTYTAAVAVTFGATPNFDANLSNYFDLGALTGNVTGATITNPIAGQTITVRVKQDGVGSRTFAVATASKITGSVTLTASTASLLTLTYNGTDSRWEGSWLGLPT